MIGIRSVCRNGYNRLVVRRRGHNVAARDGQGSRAVNQGTTVLGAANGIRSAVPLPWHRSRRTVF